MRHGLALAALFGGLACQSALVGPPRAAAPTIIERCSYALTLSATGRVRVDAACKANGPVSFHLASLNEAGAASVSSGELKYSVDLSRSTGNPRDLDRGTKLGASFLAPLSRVLAVPEPLTTEIPVTVSVKAPRSLKYAVGLRQAEQPHAYALMAHEIPVATYFAFGRLEQRVLSIGAAKLEITKLDGAMQRSFDELSAWIGTSANAVSSFYGVFPVERASVMVLPVPGRDGVIFGKVLPESAPGIALLVGQHARRDSLYSDWILIHELFHLGFPSFHDEGKWLDEGLATYYEPIIRVRAGLYGTEELWQELAESMPQGIPAFTEHGLENADDFRGIYWGGAMACLVADVEARKRDSARGLEVGLRALRAAGGNACEVWSLSDAIATIDRALGAPTLAPVAARHAPRGQAFDLEQLLRDLGVVRLASGEVRLSDDAPLAAIRRAITAQP